MGVRNSKKSGAGFSVVYTPTLWCFNELKFFDQVKNVLEGEDSIQIDTPIDNAVSITLSKEHQL